MKINTAKERKKKDSESYTYTSISANIDRQKKLLQSIKNLNESIKMLEESGYDRNSHDQRLLREKRVDLTNQLSRIRNDVEALFYL